MGRHPAIHYLVGQIKIIQQGIKMKKYKSGNKKID